MFWALKLCLIGTASRILVTRLEDVLRCLARADDMLRLLIGAFQESQHPLGDPVRFENRKSLVADSF